MCMCMNPHGKECHVGSVWLQNSQPLTSSWGKQKIDKIPNILSNSAASFGKGETC